MEHRHRREKRCRLWSVLWYFECRDSEFGGLNVLQRVFVLAEMRKCMMWCVLVLWVDITYPEYSSNSTSMNTQTISYVITGATYPPSRLTHTLGNISPLKTHDGTSVSEGMTWYTLGNQKTPFYVHFVPKVPTTVHSHPREQSFLMVPMCVLLYPRERSFLMVPMCVHSYHRDVSFPMIQMYLSSYPRDVFSIW